MIQVNKNQYLTFSEDPCYLTADKNYYSCLELFMYYNIYLGRIVDT